MNFIEMFREFLEYVKRYSTPYGFIKYAEDMLVSKEKVLLDRLCEKYESSNECVLFEEAIDVPCVVEHVTFPAVALYDDDSVTTVKIKTGYKTIASVGKIMNWVPLWVTVPIVFIPRTEIVIEPEPKKIIVLILKPLEQNQ